MTAPTLPITYAYDGLHIFRTKLPPKAWLDRLNPQTVVVVGSFEHPKAVDETQAAARTLLNWLPRTLIKVRWWKDDNILQTLSPEGVKQLIFPLHVPGTVLGIGNEDTANSSAGFQKTVSSWEQVVILATQQLIPVAIGSTSMGEPQYGLYELLIPLFQLMAAARKLGIYHIYTPNSYFPWNGNLPDIDHLARRHEQELRRVCDVAGIEPPPMMHGEWNTVASVGQADVGPIGMKLPVATWVNGILRAALQRARNVYVYGKGLYDDRWKHFDLSGDDDLSLSYREAMVTALPRSPYSLLEEYQMQLQAAAQEIDLMEYLCPRQGAEIVHLSSGETCQMVYNTAGYGKQIKNQLSEELWADDTYIYRGVDVSGYFQNDIYILWTKLPNGTLRYGSKWGKRRVKKGDIFKREEYVIRYRNDGTPYQADPVTTYLRIKDILPLWTSPSGRVVENVVELQYAYTPDFSQATAVQERYLYGYRKGLVYFWNGVMESYITQARPTSTQTPIELPWLNTLRPAKPPVEVIAPVPTLPKPTVEYGPLVEAVVVSTTLKTANVRDFPGTASGSNVIAEVVAGTYLTTRIAHPFDDHAHKWIVVESINGHPVKNKAGVAVPGYLSNVAIVAPVIREPLTVALHAPYVSQVDSTSAKMNNDCGIASLLMLVRQHQLQQGWSLPSVPTVDDLVPYTPLPAKDKQKLGLTFNEIIALALRLGADAEYVRSMTPAKIREFLDAGKPVMVLLDYGDFNPPASQRIAHLAVVDGYGPSSFNVQDPYVGGANFRIQEAALEDAMKDVPGNSQNDQGLILNFGEVRGVPRPVNFVS